MKKNRGITLIALVITIVITVILAGVAINLTVGENGVITKAQRAKEQQKIAEIQEKLELEKANVVLNGNNRITLENYLEQLKKVGIIDDEDIQPGENDSIKLVTVDNYVFSFIEENGNVTVKYEGKTGNILPTIKEIQIVKTTTNSIAVRVTAKRVNGGDYKYYIKDVEKGEDYSLKQTSKSEEYTFIELEQNKEYKVKVEVKNVGGKVEKEVEGTIKTIPVEELTEAKVIFAYEPNDWTTGKVVATASLNGITLPEGSSLQTSKDADKWDDTNSQEFNTNGWIYVRIWDGNNGGTYTAGEVSKIDREAPVIESLTPDYESVEIVAKDEKSGIVAYAVTETNTQPSESSYTSVETTNELRKVTTGLNQGTTYYVWVKDALGNVSESKEVTTSGIKVAVGNQWTFTYDENGSTPTFALPANGKYKIELYGAAGGNVGSYNGGSGGKVEGTYSGTRNQEVEMQLSEKGSLEGYSSTVGVSEYTGSAGGAASTIKIDSTMLAIAGGGGGATPSSNGGSGGSSTSTSTSTVSTPSSTSSSSPYRGGSGAQAGSNGTATSSTHTHRATIGGCLGYSSSSTSYTPMTISSSYKTHASYSFSNSKFMVRGYKGTHEYGHYKCTAGHTCYDEYENKRVYFLSDVSSMTYICAIDYYSSFGSCSHTECSCTSPSRQGSLVIEGYDSSRGTVYIWKTCNYKAGETYMTYSSSTGGSSYYNSSKLTSVSTSAGVNSTNGYCVITLLELN